MLLEDGFDTYSKKGETNEEEEMVWGAGTGVFNLNSSSLLPTNSIIPSTDKAGVFPYFSNVTTFLASYLSFTYSETPHPASSSSYPPSEGSLTVFPKLAAF